MNAIRPCPFCGSTPHETDVVHTEDYFAYVLCRGCSAGGPSIEVFETNGSTKAAAFEQWNKRKLPEV